MKMVTLLIYCQLDMYFILFKDFIYLFLQRGKGRKKEREGNIDVTEKHRSVAACTHPDQRPN